MDPSQTELKAGLEIHQQIDTHKLFCDCSSHLSENVTGKVVRRLRTTASELGEIDRAALLQGSRGFTYVYEITDNSCLVELDEEPPHPPCREAIDIALEVAALLHSKPVDEIHFMRKIVVDGSNTSGFQRTALVSLGGYLEVNGRRIGIQSICCEEDACRKISSNGSEITYRLDRLGIPLLEIATEPDIDSPDMLKATARRIGMLLRATGKVKRGIGTIREDVNISIKGGARVEIKGVQELDMLTVIARREAERQQKLIAASLSLKERGASVSGWIDVTESVRSLGSGVLRKAVERGEAVGAVLMRGFDGVLGRGEKLLGAEIAQRLRASGFGGIMHSDELPAYGIGEEGKRQIFRILGGRDGDAFVLCAAEKEKLPLAFALIKERAEEAFLGVPEETRDALTDGSTVYSRPLPGSARMYPETDVLPLAVTPADLSRISLKLPEPFDVQARRLHERYGLHMQQCTQLAEEGLAPLFQDICDKEGNPAVLARILLNYIPEAERATGVEFTAYADLRRVMHALKEGRFAKEAAGEIIQCMLRGKTAVECIEAVSSDAQVDARTLIENIVESHSDLIRERGEGALGPLMGIAMKELRGKVDGKRISELLIDAIKKRMVSP
ncbi:MAG: Glu-tRNA(Gln) amidotransferase subunit GatE [Methanomassiliicoccales archaeon]